MSLMPTQKILLFQSYLFWYVNQETFSSNSNGYGKAVETEGKSYWNLLFTPKKQINILILCINDYFIQLYTYTSY